MNKKFHTIEIIVLVTVAITIILLLPWLLTLSAQDILSFTPENPFLAALVLLGIYCIKPIFVFIPLMVLYIAAGIMFPPVWAILLTYVGLASEFTIGYFIGRKLGNERASALLKKYPRAESVVSIISRNDKTSCFICRLLPLPLPIDVVSMLFGASGVPFWHYMPFSLLGVTAAMIPTVIAGQAISNPLSIEFLLPFTISLAVSISVLIINLYLTKKRKRLSQIEKPE